MVISEDLSVWRKNETAALRQSLPLVVIAFQDYDSIRILGRDFPRRDLEWSGRGSRHLRRRFGRCTSILFHCRSERKLPVQVQEDTPKRQNNRHPKQRDLDRLRDRLREAPD